MRWIALVPAWLSGSLIYVLTHSAAIGLAVLVLTLPVWVLVIHFVDPKSDGEPQSGEPTV